MTNAQSTQQSIYGSKEWKAEQLQILKDQPHPAEVPAVGITKIPIFVNGMLIKEVDVIITANRVFSATTGVQRGWEIDGHDEKFVILDNFGGDFQFKIELVKKNGYWCDSDGERLFTWGAKGE